MNGLYIENWWEGYRFLVEERWLSCHLFILDMQEMGRERKRRRRKRFCL